VCIIGFVCREAGGSFQNKIVFTYLAITTVSVKCRNNTKKMRRYIKWEDRFQELTGRCYLTESCRVHTRQWRKIKAAEPRHRFNHAPGLHNTKLSSFMLLVVRLVIQSTEFLQTYIKQREPRIFEWGF
jgi:hypothetical protein